MSKETVEEEKPHVGHSCDIGRTRVLLRCGTSIGGVLNAQDRSIASHEQQNMFRGVRDSWAQGIPEGYVSVLSVAGGQVWRKRDGYWNRAEKSWKGNERIGRLPRSVLSLSLTC